MKIDKQSPVRIYYQIMEQLKAKMKCGELQPDMFFLLSVNMPNDSGSAE